jgi:hypothetical protein
MTGEPIAAAAAPAPEPTHEKRACEGIEIAAAIVLGLAAVLTAWSAYQAVTHSGESLRLFTESSLTSASAQQQYGAGDQQYTEDLVTFIDYVKATSAGDTALVAKLRSLMAPELVAGLAWMQTQPEPRPDSPFDKGSPTLTNEYYAEGTRLEAIANEQFSKGQAAGEASDTFTLSTVLYAVVLFFAGIATTVRRPGMAVASLVFASVVLVAATVHLVMTQLSA